MDLIVISFIGVLSGWAFASIVIAVGHRSEYEATLTAKNKLIKEVSELFDYMSSTLRNNPSAATNVAVLASTAATVLRSRNIAELEKLQRLKVQR